MTGIDDITMVAGILLLLLAVVTPMANVFFRKVDVGMEFGSDVIRHDGKEPDFSESDSETAVEESSMALPPVSIVLAPHENALELEENLPLYLSLEYEPGFEVIVVACKGDARTEDVLKRYADSPKLYTTFIPVSSRYMSRKKLAVTLGVKAAKNEWIMLTDIECRPKSSRWLQVMARNCKDTVDMVMGYTCYEAKTSAYRRFERLQTNLYLMREAQRGTAYRTDSKNLMFRKSMFVEQDGFRGNLKYLRGEYDFMVNKYARKGNVALECCVDGWTIEKAPTDKTWRDKHLFYIENRKHLSRSASHRFLYNFDQTLMHLNNVAIISAGLFSAITERWTLMCAVGMALAVTVLARTIMAKKKLRLFAENISAIRIFFYENGVIWHRLGYMLGYGKADKNDFISHKV